MQKIIDGEKISEKFKGNSLYIGSDFDCPLAMSNDTNKDISIVHCCKTCHKKKLGYQKNLDKDDENYLFYRSGNDLYLNMIDPIKPLFKNALFTEASKFIDERLAVEDVLVHCNAGMSRSPSVVMMYLASRGVINGEEYCFAKSDFTERYFKHYVPGEGITTFLTWSFADLVEKMK